MLFRSRVFRAVAWRMGDRADFVRRHGDALDLAFHLTENAWRGERTIELSVADIRPAAPGNGSVATTGPESVA